MKKILLGILFAVGLTSTVGAQQVQRSTTEIVCININRFVPRIKQLGAKLIFQAKEENGVFFMAFVAPDGQWVWATYSLQEKDTVCILAAGKTGEAAE